VGEPGHIPREIRVSITDLVEGRLDDRLRSDVVAPLAAKFPNVDLDLDPERTQGRGYYETVCFHVHARDRSGAERLLVDGGFTDWTGRLLSDRKERLLISGIGTERLVGTGRPEGK
jgi:hypothetical protein